MNTNGKEKRTKKKKGSWEMNSFFQGPCSRCQVSSFNLFCLTLLLFFLCPFLTLSLTFSLQFLWEKCKLILLPQVQKSIAQFQYGESPRTEELDFNIHISQGGVLASILFCPHKNKTEKPT